MTIKELKTKIIESVKGGINVSLFGMEASGHNTFAEEILKSVGDSYLSFIDPRLFAKYNEDLIKHYLLLSLKGLNSKTDVGKFKNFDDFIYIPSEKRKLVILFKNTEVAIEKYPQIFKFLRGISRMKRGSIVFIFTGNHRALRKETAKIEDSEIFIGNVLINKTYGLKKSRDIFSSYSFTKKWINKSLMKDVLSLCGGNPNVIQGIARYFNSCKAKPISLSPSTLINKNEICVRLNQIYLSLSESEIEVLKSVLENKNLIEAEGDLDLLKRIGLINSEGKLFSPLFSEFLLQKFIKTNSKIYVENKTLYINNQISKDLTKNEFILLRLFLKNEGKILNRDKIFEEVWCGNYEKYSDWNLDQLIRRLRRKLTKYNLADNLLTVKKRGFMWYFD